MTVVFWSHIAYVTLAISVLGSCAKSHLIWFQGLTDCQQQTYCYKGREVHAWFVHCSKIQNALYRRYPSTASPQHFYTLHFTSAIKYVTFYVTFYSLRCLSSHQQIPVWCPYCFQTGSFWIVMTRWSHSSSFFYHKYNLHIYNAYFSWSFFYHKYIISQDRISITNTIFTYLRW